MRKTLRFFLAGGLVMVSAWLALRADPPPERTTGRVLLLENNRALEGEIVREGNQYRIRRDQGEVSIPAEKATRLCLDWHEAFEVLKLQANLYDADERMRLARWCMTHNLRELALGEVQAVLKQRPQHQEAKHLTAILERGLQTPPLTVQAAPQVVVPRPALDLGAESLASFNTKVQPILMNACASCHATGRGGEFKLTRCYDGQLNRKATQDNLAAVLPYLRADQPEQSLLLVKAVSLHGNANQAPLQARASIPFKTLNEWVHQVVASNPHLRKEMASAAPTAVSRPPTPTVVVESTPPRPLALPGEPKAQTVAESTPPLRVSPEPTPNAGPADEFDPLHFNRVAHPDRKN